MSILVDLIERTISKYAGKPALYCHPTNFSYERIGDAINRFAQGLKNHQIRKGDRVIIFLPNLVQFPIAYFATLKLGAVAVPINFLFSEIQLNRLITLINPKAIIVWDRIYPGLPKAAFNPSTKLIVLGEKPIVDTLSFTHLMAQSSPLEQSVDIDSREIAVIFFTAGNSGQPKAVEISHNALAANCLAFRNAFMLKSEETFVAALPLFLPINQVLILNSAFITGARILLHPAFEPKVLCQQIEAEKGTIMVGNAALYHAFLNPEIKCGDIASLKYCITYGEIFNRKIYEQFEKKFGHKLYESYGLCESTSLVTLNRTNGEHRPGSAGLAIDNVFIRIVDDAGNVLGENEIGEIRVQSPGLMTGYRGENTTESHIIDGWLKTGDIGKIDESGYLYVLERKQNVILKSGFMVFPREIESLLMMHPKVNEVAVIGVPDSVQGEEVKACVVLKPNETATAADLIEFCRSHLENYKCPQIIQFYQVLPKSPTGRILKYRLKEANSFL